MKVVNPCPSVRAGGSDICLESEGKKPGLARLMSALKVVGQYQILRRG